MSVLRRAFERRSSQPYGDSSIPTNGQSRGPVGSPHTPDGAMRILTVYGCVSLLADAVSTLPLQVYKGQGPDRKPLDPPPLVAQPSGEITLQAWLGQGMVSQLLRGDAIGLVAARDRLGYATQIELVHPDQVRITRNRDTGVREYRVGGVLQRNEDVFHVPGLMMPGAVQGMNPIEYARTSLALSSSAELFGERFFSNGTALSGVVSVPGSLPPDEARAMAQTFLEAHQGIDNAHLPAVLTAGATWAPMSIAPDDAQFLQTRSFQKSEISGLLFRIPPHMIGEVDKTTSWGTGIEQQERGFVTNTLGAWLKRWEDAFTANLPRGQYARFNLAARLRGDTLQRYQAYTLARSGGWMNVDEIRSKEDMPPLPDGQGQVYLQPLNMGTPGGVDPMGGNDPMKGTP